MNRQRYFTIGIAGTLIFASLLVFTYLTNRGEALTILSAPLLYDASPEQTEAQRTDLKLATRGSTIAFATTTMKQDPEQEKAIGGPVPTPAGCNLYANILYSKIGDTLTYTISISSIGAHACTNVSYSVYYPAGQQYVSALPKPTASDYYWVLGNLYAGETRTLSLTATNVTGDLLELCATADNAKADACTTAGQSVPALQPTSALAQTAVSGDADTPATPSGKEFGVWVWDSPLSLSGQKTNSIVAAAVAAGMNVIYITVDDVLTQDKAQFSTALAAFVDKANANGIAVDAVVGARDWAKPAMRYKGYAVIDFVKEYNKTNPKIRAFQYDVEPYLLPEYENDKAPVLTDFVAFIDASALRLAGSGIQFSVVIPHFYDGTQSWTPKVVLDGTSDHAYGHILRILDRNPGSMVIVMAYRNYFEGAGGTREIVSPEVEQAGVTKVIVAQETGNVEPDYVTFYGHSRSDLFSALNSIQDAFKNSPGFGGVAVHYMDPYLELR